jgi:uncharacterized membrane protein YeaQ/YmgE (transglycosylase-associated protein family)
MTSTTRCFGGWLNKLAIAFLTTGFLLIARSAPGADASDTVDKAKEAVQETVQNVEQAGRSAAESTKEALERMDAARLKNRTPDEIVAWVIMGALAGSLAGMFTKLKPTGLGQLGRLFLGLAGAFLGGMVIHATRIDFGWGFVMIRYEELLFAFLGAIVLLALGRVFRSKARKKNPDV